MIGRKPFAQPKAVNEGQEGHDAQYDRLKHTDQIIIACTILYGLEKNISEYPTYNRANGKIASDTQLYQMRFSGPEDVHNGHGKNSQPRQEADRTYAHQVHRIQRRLDDHASSDPAYPADHRRRQTNQE